MSETDLTAAVSETAAGARLKLRARPRAKTSAFTGLHNGAVKVDLAAAPVDGKANAALLKFLSAALDTPKAGMTLAAGQSSRHKTVVFAGVSAAALRKKLAALLP